MNDRRLQYFIRFCSILKQPEKEHIPYGVAAKAAGINCTKPSADILCRAGSLSDAAAFCCGTS